MKNYDLVVIGTGPAGQKAAIQGAKLGKKVAVIEKNHMLGGVAIHTGTIPSKALREAVMHLTGYSRRGLYGDASRAKKHITFQDLIYVSQQVIHNEMEVLRDAFERNNIDLIYGAAHFEGPNLMQIERLSDSELLTADRFVIATGTRPAHPANIPFDGRSIFTSDEVLKLESIPKSMIVVGGGVIGTEYACIMATLGVKVSLIEGRAHVLGFLDDEIADAFHYHMRSMGITLRLGEKVNKIEMLKAPSPLPVPGAEGTDANGNGGGSLVQATLESGKHLKAQTLLYAVGRQGTTGALKLENVGVQADDRERLKVNANYQTEVAHVYAAGDVIGFPALASTAMEQGRKAVCHMYGLETKSSPELFPLGIYAVPEISMVGKTEAQLTSEGVPYEAGIAQYKELARAQLLGDETGMLKLLIHEETHKILGVHVIGTHATELVHIGQAVMSLGGTAEFFINNVFNYPTLAEAYRVAALNGLNKLAHI